jgi:hypothetical protein
LKHTRRTSSAHAIPEIPTTPPPPFEAARFAQEVASTYEVMVGTDADDSAEEAATIRPNYDLAEFARSTESLLSSNEVRKLPDEDGVPTPRLPMQSGVVIRDEDLVRSLPYDAIPSVVVPPTDLEWFELDAFRKAVIGRIDGKTSVIELAEELGSGRTAALQLLGELLRWGVIRLD